MCEQLARGAERSGIEPVTSRLQVRRPNHHATHTAITKQKQHEYQTITNDEQITSLLSKTYNLLQELSYRKQIVRQLHKH